MPPVCLIRNIIDTRREHKTPALWKQRVIYVGFSSSRRSPSRAGGRDGVQEAEATVRIVKESRAEESRGSYRQIGMREGSKEIRKSREGRKKAV